MLGSELRDLTSYTAMWPEYSPTASTPPLTLEKSRAVTPDSVLNHQSG